MLPGPLQASVNKKDVRIDKVATTSWYRGATSRQEDAATTVILVHGLWTPAAIFMAHGHWLRRRGYRTLRFAYPSMRATLAQNALALRDVIATSDATDIHLVGHSLGGLVILDALRQAPDPRLHRVVLLGTPCLDSHCARQLAKLAGISVLLGSSLGEWLSRAPNAAVAPLAAIEVGVLAGTRSVGLGRLIGGLPRPNDGVVALAETRLPGATDFIALPVAHAEMLISRPCFRQIAAFVETGHFLHHQQV